MKIITNKETLNLNIDILNFIFEYQDEQEKQVKISFNQIISQDLRLYIIHQKRKQILII